MRLLPRRPVPQPADLRERLGLSAKTRILAWGAGEGYLAATEDALHLERPPAVLGWDVITKATWEEPSLIVTTEAAGDRPAGTIRLRVDQSGDLPAAIRDRVTASVVATEMVDIGDGVMARMVARRASDHAPIRWSVVFEAGVDASDPLLQERARAALDHLRNALGI